MLIAVIGGGQLGRMLALAGIPLGMRFRFLDPSPDCPAAAVGETVVGAYDDPAALSRLIDGADRVTYEFENVPAAAAEFVAQRTMLSPSGQSLTIAQDRIAEKDFFKAAGVPVQAYRGVASEAELAEALREVGVPGVLKTRRLGYDGKGQAVIRDPAAASVAWQAVGRVPCIYEAFVPFEREISVVATRGQGGEFAAHPPTQNEHRGGILRLSTVPTGDAFTDDRELARAAITATRMIAERLQHVGTLAVEFFVTKGPSGASLVANEMAPRVHNSGHWTIEGAFTSQFENHVRAVAGLPLGDPAERSPAAMLNLIGTVPPIGDLLRVPGARLHLYGKAPKPGRKLGHVTVTAADADALGPLVARLRRIIDG
jgi:5-(carboxyamino)imidazole ribonucleotide synthase